MWTTSAFVKMVLKLVIVRDLLLLDLRVLYMDCDILLFKDPFPYLQQYEHLDMVAQRDETLCAGFMYIQPTTVAKRHFFLSIMEMYRRGIMDQDALTITVNATDASSFAYLPSDLFENGHLFSMSHQFFWDHPGMDSLSCCE